MSLLTSLKVMNYKLTKNPNQVIRLDDGTTIPDVSVNYGDALLYQQWLAAGNTPTTADSSPTPLPDWDGLRDRALAGDLYPVFQRLTATSLAPDANAISTARGDINNAILVVRKEAALASGLALLVGIGGYTFTSNEKTLWNNAVTQLNFSSAVRLS